MKATIQKIIQETPRVLTFIVVPERPIAFKTGQAMKWNIPQVPIGRLFSVASPGGDAATELWFTIRISDDGKFTARLRFLKEGDVIELAGPFGKFIFDEADTSDVGLIAGGTGIP